MTGWRAGIISAICLVAFWQGLVWAFNLPKFLLPGPALVVDTLWTSRALIFENTLVTLGEVIVGLLAGTFLGGASAIGLMAFPRLRPFLRPFLIFSQAIPVFALAPLLTLWMGYGYGAKIVMAIIIIYFPITSAFFDALMRTNPQWLELAKVMGAKKSRMLWLIRVPAALPGLASGLRLAAVYAPIGAYLGEWVGASKGLGFLMFMANGRAKTDLLFAAVLVLAVMTLTLYVSIDAFCKRYLDRKE